MAELRNIRWKKLLKDLVSTRSLEILLKSRSLQWSLTYCLRRQNHIVLNELDGLVLEYKGIKFRPHPLNYPRMFEAWDRYHLECLREDDVVLDLGANVGSFSLPASKICRAVVAVEPLFYEELLENKGLNQATNLIALPWSIELEDVGCQEYRIKTKPTPLKEFEAVTFVRMDIGGAEWLIDPEVVVTDTVRHFEGEFHFWTRKQRKGGEKGLGRWLSHLESKGLGYVLRWSKHKHWGYVSADKEWTSSKEVQLKDGSFIEKNKELWRTL